MLGTAFQHPRKAVPCMSLWEQRMEDILSYFETSDSRAGRFVPVAW
jgi:hypothetical protein